MRDLIEALTIFLKYVEKEYEERYPTHCAHDELFIMIDPERVSETDKKRLEELSFSPTEDGTFSSHRFGSN